MTSNECFKDADLRFTGQMLWREQAPRNTTPNAGAASSWCKGDWSIIDGAIHRTHSGEPHERSRAFHPELSLTGWAIPGLVDVHCHIGVGPGGPVDRDVQVQQAQLDRDAGTLLLRDCGVPVDNSWMKDRRDMPRLIRAGRHIARHKRYIRGLAIELEDSSRLPETMYHEAQHSDGWVKIVGDWIDRSEGVDSDLNPLFSRDELIEGVAAAHEAGAKVTVHTFSHRAIDDLLEAGVDGIEHGTGMDDDQLAEAASRGILVTPTLLQCALFSTFAEQAGTKYPVYARTMMGMFEQRREHAQRLFESGVIIMPGTDAGGYQRHGCLPDELALWAEIGIEHARILDIATWRARDVLGARVLEEGAPADLVIYEDDPRVDITVLARPRAVILNGALVGGSIIGEVGSSTTR